MNNKKLPSEDAGHRDWQNVRKNNLQNMAKEPEKPTTTNNKKPLQEKGDIDVSKWYIDRRELNTWPEVGSTSPTRILINVLFPAPLGPRTPNISPKKEKKKRKFAYLLKRLSIVLHTNTAITPTFFYTKVDMVSCHFLNFPSKKKIFLLIIFFMQTAN